MYTLGIETSCDETSCAILKDYRVLSNVTISSLREHKKYGGVVPEIATRAHLKNIDKVLTAALKQAHVSLGKIGLISVTYKPGLIGALLVGVEFAKALSFSLKVPFLGVDHLHAHLFAPFLNNSEKIKFPFLGVVVSGGHTDIYLVNDFDNIEVIGRTRDDACGEVFDKVARALGLGYPGGPVIDKLFDVQYKDDFKFKCGRVGFDLSFSGIKTAVVYKNIQLQEQGKVSKKLKIRLVSSFQKAVITTLVNTIFDAADKFKLAHIVCGGGVIANRYLREQLQKRRKGYKVSIARLGYTTDNSAMVAGLGFYLYNIKNRTSPLNLRAEAN